MHVQADTRIESQGCTRLHALHQQEAQHQHKHNPTCPDVSWFWHSAKVLLAGTPQVQTKVKSAPTHVTILQPHKKIQTYVQIYTHKLHVLAATQQAAAAQDTHLMRRPTTALTETSATSLNNHQQHAPDHFLFFFLLYTWQYSTDSSATVAIVHSRNRPWSSMLKSSTPRPPCGAPHV